MVSAYMWQQKKITFRCPSITKKKELARSTVVMDVEITLGLQGFLKVDGEG